MIEIARIIEIIISRLLYTESWNIVIVVIIISLIVSWRKKRKKIKNNDPKEDKK